jgi:ABC-type transport system substrate-binding protein
MLAAWVAPAALTVAEEPTVLRQAIHADVRSLDPATCSDLTSAALQGHVLEGLFSYHYLHRPARIVPALARSLPTVSQDGKVYTIRLREGVTYQPNPCFGVDDRGRLRTREVVADDFVLAFQRIADSALRPSTAWALLSDSAIVGLGDYSRRTEDYEIGDFDRYYAENIAGIRSRGAHVLEIRLQEPRSHLPYLLTGTFLAPVPREAIDYWLGGTVTDAGWRELPKNRRSCEFTDHRALVGTGAYAWKSLQRRYDQRFVQRRGQMRAERRLAAAEAVFVASRTYRDVRYPRQGAPGDREAGLLDDAGKRLPLIDELRYVYIERTSDAWEQFTKGHLAAAGIPPEWFAEIVDPETDRLTADWRGKGLRLAVHPGSAAFWLLLDHRRGPLGESRPLRQALSLAIDREALIAKHFHGRGTPAGSLLPASFQVVRSAGRCQYARHDLDDAVAKRNQARKQLADANALHRGELPPLTLDTMDYENESDLARRIKSQLTEAGLHIRLRVNTLEEMLGRLDRGTVEMMILGYYADYPDPHNFLQQFYSGAIETGKNRSGYRSDAYDKLYLRMLRQTDPARRDELIVEMIRMLHEDCPVIPLYEPKVYLLHHAWLGNVKPHPFANDTAKYWRIARPDNE